MTRAAMIVLLLLLAIGCSAGGPSGEPPEATEAPAEARDLRVSQIVSGAPGQAPARARVIVAPSAAALSREIGGEVPDRGEGTYVAAYWGEKPTGGYTLGVKSARLQGAAVTVRLLLREPSPDAMVTQALTYPYAVAVVEGLDPRDKSFTFMDQNDRELDWPVRRAR